MNFMRTLGICFLFLLFNTVNAQQLTIGIENGINYSNLHKKLDSYRFKSQQGPVNGVFAKYQLGYWFVIQSGITNITYHYERQAYKRAYYPDFNYPSPSSIDLGYYPDVYISRNHSRFSFLRIPLLMSFRTPGRVNFEIGGGSYYAFLTNDEFRGKDQDFYDNEYKDENFPEMDDWGLILSSSITYNINNKWSIFASGKLTYGKEKYYDNIEGKMGSAELLFGVGYKPFEKQKDFISLDTLGKRIFVLPHAGVNLSRAKSDKNQSEYSSLPGFTSGVSLKFLLSKDASILTGVWYDRKGYSIDYNGNWLALYQQYDQSNTQTKSEIRLDYVTLPLMMDLSFGEKLRSCFEFGLYFSLLQNAFAQGEQIETNNYNHGYRINKRYFNESLDLWFKNTDFGLMLAYRLEAKVFKWAGGFLSLNQSIGMSNILNDREEAIAAYPFIKNEKIRNSSTAIQFGLILPVNKN